MNHCQSLESVIYSKDVMDAPITAPPDSKNIAQGLRLGTQDTSVKRNTLFTTILQLFAYPTLLTYMLQLWPMTSKVQSVLVTKCPQSSSVTKSLKGNKQQVCVSHSSTSGHSVTTYFHLHIKDRNFIGCQKYFFYKNNAKYNVNGHGST